MLISTLERLAIRIFEAGQKEYSMFNRKKEAFSPGFYLGRSQKPYNPQEEENVFIPPHERAGHLYIIGGSGTGKTTFIERCLQYDILQNKGWCLVDPHGDISQKIITFLAALWQNKDRRQKEEMAKRFVLIEPSNYDKAVGFNPLEVSSGNSVYACALELMEVFKRRWEFGPRMEELFRTCLVTLCENKMTLLEIPLLLTNREARGLMVENLTNQEIKDYWLFRYNKLSPGSEIQYREPVLNKTTEFITDEKIRYLLGQAKSSFDFRRAMDEGKWIIIDIPKGRLKSNSLLLGGLFMAKLQIAGLSRTDTPLNQRRSFSIYLDEFQNFINAKEGGDVETMLSESRKYNLQLIMAHQNLAQLDNSLLNSIFGNVNALFCFRLSHKDALTLAPELNPLDKKMLCNNLIKLRIGETYLKVKGKPTRLVKISLPKPYYVHPEVVKEFKALSSSFSAKPALEIKKEIEERHRRLGIIKRTNSAPINNVYLNRANPAEGQNGW